MRILIFQILGTLFAAGPAVAAAPQVIAPKVVLVHGFLETGISFKMLQKRLEKRGCECYVPKLKHSDGRGGLENLAVYLKKDIEAKFGPEQPIQIVAFSMGGLVSRYYLQNLGGAKRCENFITVASPHNGTKAAWLYPTQGAVQMRPGSEFLADLDATQDSLKKLKITSYRTRLDLIILPSTSSVWDRAENLEHPALLHPLMLTSNHVLTGIEDRILSSSRSHKNSSNQKHID
jgi:triacylglycerol lipase